MRVDLVLLPSLMTDAHAVGRSVVVFDVLRATTTMAAALGAGVAEIRIYPDTTAAAHAAGPPAPTRLLCGEQKCLPPAGFDLGNSPSAFGPPHKGRVMHLSTTNGTRAILAAKAAAAVYPGALVNASAVARAVAAAGRDVTLLCAGTDGAVAFEDVLGAGAVLSRLERISEKVTSPTDEALLARELYRAAGSDLRHALARSRGGQNVTAAGLSADIDYAARLDVLDVVGVIAEPGIVPPVVTRL